MKLAAIDIGSNAVRCQISTVLHHNGKVFFKKVEYVRYALRLGEDVFTTGHISDAKKVKFYKLLKALQLLMEVHDVEQCMVCATSAMREAKNARGFVTKVKEQLGLQIEIIDGNEEAYLVNKVIVNELEDEQNYLHIDVGGGSTELNIYVNRQKVASKSFEVGSIRSIKGKDTAMVRSAMKGWVKEQAAIYNLYRAIGTGGNIGKLYEMAGKKEGLALSRTRIEEVVEQIENTSMEDRINVMLLNPDRADVIIPASQIYLSVMKWAGVRSILVPNVGLKDGMMLTLYERLHKNHAAENSPVIVSDSDTA